MGLKKQNYTFAKLDLMIEEAYAQVTELHIKKDICTAIFSIQQSREEIVTKEAIEKVSVIFKADRKTNQIEQAYLKAKEDLFADWEDDIVTEATTEESTEVAEE